MAKPESFNLWTWEKCKDVLLTLPGRLGFPKSDSLQFLGLEVNLKNGGIRDLTLNKPFDPKIEYIFFLLYQYAKAKETPLTNDYISYKQISGGRVYASVFEGRAVKPIERLFATTPELFQVAAERLKGVPANIGDLAFTITGLPLVPYTYTIWKGDEEFPARAKVFLDGSARYYLDAEAHAHLASLITYRLLAIARALG
ncbi:MAG: DUF3786 domain-containing protein [Promethearchaeota archaeon]